MPLPLLLLPVFLLLPPIILFVLLRWWIGKTGPTILLTSSLILNFTLFGPLLLTVLLAVEVRDFQEKMPTAAKALIVESGPEILLAVSFTEVKDLEQGLSSFKPLGKEQVARLTGLGEARYEDLSKDYYKVFVVKREFLEKLAAPLKPSPPGSQGAPGVQSPLGLPGAQGGPGLPGPAMTDPSAILSLLGSTRDAFLAGDLDRVARDAVGLQKAFGQQGMGEAADLARQWEQAAKARDAQALEALGPRLAQFASSAGGRTPGSGAPPLPIPGEVILKAIDAEDPAKVLSPYLPPQTLQEIGGGGPTELKLTLLAFLLQAGGFDPLSLLKEYQAGHILVYPASTISVLVKLLPLAALPEVPIIL